MFRGYVSGYASGHVSKYVSGYVSEYRALDVTGVMREGTEVCIRVCIGVSIRGVKHVPSHEFLTN